MTIRTTIIQWNESRKSCSPNSNNFWWPCICCKWTSSEKPREHHCICFQPPSMLHPTLKWKSECNFLMFIEVTVSQGYYFYTNDVANITLAEQIKIRFWRVQNNVESQLRRKLCAVKQAHHAQRKATRYFVKPQMCKPILWSDRQVLCIIFLYHFEKMLDIKY